MESDIFDSWKIINDKVSIKTTDLSVFKYNGSGIPKDLKSYWNIEDLLPGDKRNIILIFSKIEYKAYIKIDKTISHRAQIFWYSDLGSIFNNLFPDYTSNESRFPLLRFEKLSPDKYIISFINITDKNNDVANTNLGSENIFNQNIGITPLTNNPKYEPELTSCIVEGNKRLVYTTRYERNPLLRRQALSIHGYTCMACGFNFLKTYGEIGRNFIHIHHVNALSEFGEQTVDPEKDLIAVCPNCHCVIHRDKDHTLTLDELRNILKNNQ